MDRGYNSISEVDHSVKNDEKFVIRLDHSKLKKEYQTMKSEDQWLEIENQYDRIKYYKDIDSELYNYYIARNTLKIRFVNILKHF